MNARPAILWFRKDLRIDDNAALQAALEAGGPVIPVYIREPAHVNVGPLGAAQSWWLHHSLISLRTSLKSLGSDLVLRAGPAEDVLLSLRGIRAPLPSSSTAPMSEMILIGRSRLP